jgi:hypothetical protein
MDKLLAEYNGWQLIRWARSGMYFVVKYGPGECQHWRSKFAHTVEHAMETFENNVLAT